VPAVAKGKELLKEVVGDPNWVSTVPLWKLRLRFLGAVLPTRCGHLTSPSSVLGLRLDYDPVLAAKKAPTNFPSFFHLVSTFSALQGVLWVQAGTKKKRLALVVETP